MASTMQLGPHAGPEGRGALLVDVGAVGFGAGCVTGVDGGAGAGWVDPPLLPDPDLPVPPDPDPVDPDPDPEPEPVDPDASLLPVPADPPVLELPLEELPLLIPDPPLLLVLGLVVLTTDGATYWPAAIFHQPSPLCCPVIWSPAATPDTTG